MTTVHGNDVCVVLISGSPSRDSRSRQLLGRAARAFARAGARPLLVDLSQLPADALLGRTRAPPVDEALAAVADAQIVAVSTPVYRASYSGLLKVFFDLLPPGVLAGKVALPIATGGSAAHQLVIDHALRPLLASLDAMVVASGVYGTDSQFGPPTGPDAGLLARTDRAVQEALAIAAAGNTGPMSPHTIEE